MKKFQATPTKQDLGTPFGIPFRNSNEQPRPFYMGVSPTQGFNPHFCLQIFIFANEFYKHVHCHANQTHFHMKGWAPGLVFQLSQHLLRTLEVSFANTKETRPLGMRILIINNCIVLYGRWVPEISRGFNFDQPAPRQYMYNTPMARNPCNPAMSSHTVFQAPVTLSGDGKGRSGRGGG